MRLGLTLSGAASKFARRKRERGEASFTVLRSVACRGVRDGAFLLSSGGLYLGVALFSERFRALFVP